MRHNELLYPPIVFAVGSDYQIFIRVKEPAMIMADVGGVTYYDHSNGILRSNTPVHKVIVPQSELDKARSYTVIVRTLKERKAYHSRCFSDEREEFAFRPVPAEGEVVICHLADVHGRADLAEKALSRLTREPDLLILNGDIIDSSQCVEYFDVIYELCARVAGGRIPVIFSRGNHDLRGVCAEKLEDYVCTRNGSSYFQLCCSQLWCLVVDTGEDKPDDNDEYGSTVCCEAFRRTETEYIKSVIDEGQFNRPEIKHRLIICHTPFTFRQKPPFDIERGLYAEWAGLIEKGIKPELMLSGHMHETGVFEPGHDRDELGQPCTVILGSDVDKRGRSFTLAQIVLGDDGHRVDFIDA